MKDNIEFRQTNKSLSGMALGYSGTCSHIGMAYYDSTVTEFRQFNNGLWSKWKEIPGSARKD